MGVEMEEMENACPSSIELPVDSKGRPLHVGDFIECHKRGMTYFREIVSIEYNSKGCVVRVASSRVEGTRLDPDVLAGCTWVAQPTLKCVANQMEYSGRGDGGISFFELENAYIPALRKIAAIYEGEE